jgi:transposase
MRQVREILRLKYEQGLPHRAIARACGIGVGTVGTYCQRAQQAGVTWPVPVEWDDAQLEARLFRRVSDIVGVPRPLPDMAQLHHELKQPGVTLQRLHLEYLAHHPTGYRYSQFCRYYERWVATLKPTMRQVHRAGEKVFVDFSGKRPGLTDPTTGEVSSVDLFVGALGASSYVYAEACPSQALPAWIAAHVRMVEFFGGAPALFVPDNLPSGVTTPCRYEPGINRTYLEFAQHYGAAVVPARAGHPRDKAVVEANVLVAQHLRPLPATRYELGEWRDLTVNIDYPVVVEHNFYSVPYQLVHQPVAVRVAATTVEIFLKGRRIASHRRRGGRGQFATDPAHMPAAHRAHAEWTPSRLIAWAGTTGPATADLVTAILAAKPHPEQTFSGRCQVAFLVHVSRGFFLQP